jgi:hypothetical protein
MTLLVAGRVVGVRPLLPGIPGERLGVGVGVVHANKQYVLSGVAGDPEAVVHLHVGERGACGRDDRIDEVGEDGGGH